MPFTRSNAADKIIVDRRKPRRNSETAQAVRKTRERLAQQPGSIVFDRELLKLHARAMVSGATAIPLLVLVIAAAGLFASMSVSITGWALITVACYALLAFVALRADRTPAEKINVKATSQAFLVGHFISGLGWAYLASLDCGQCQIEQFPVIKAVLLLLAIGATALIAANRRMLPVLKSP